MMFAHYLWRHTPEGATADESTWRTVLDQISEDTEQLMYGHWRALATNERRVASALATASASLYSDETAAVFGLNRNSVRRALDGLRAKADILTVDGQPRLTDPLLEHWLQSRGAAPGEADDD